MRVSTDKDDAGYATWCKLTGDGMKARVFLGDVEQRDCNMADDEAGEVRRIVRGASGDVAWDRNTGEVLTETVRGAVKIVTVPA